MTGPARVALSMLALLFVIGGSGRLEAGEYLLYYLGGQSNMDGYGLVSELPESLQGAVPGVLIYHGNSAPDGVAPDGRGVWEPLRPGHGAGFQTNGRRVLYADRFGPELGMAQRLRELQPERSVAFIKYSRGGTSIDQVAGGAAGSWDTDFAGAVGDGKGVNQYDHFLATVRAALAVDDIDGDGEPDTLIPAGIVWMQGESDAHHSREVAERYQANLTRLMELIRAALHADDLPVVIGRISDSHMGDPGFYWAHAEIVRRAQEAFVAEDSHAALVVETDEYGYSDPYHYDSAGFLALGERFAEALVELGEVERGARPQSLGPAHAGGGDGSVGVASFALRVHDMDAMVAFYGEAFGLQFRAVETQGLDSRFATKGALTFKFVPLRESEDFEEFPSHQIGFKVDDVEGVIALAVRHGGRQEGELATVDGKLHGAVRDPDGNTVELYER